MISLQLVDDNMEDKEYKPADNTFIKEIRNDLEANINKFRDPVVLGEMVFRLLEERENTNRILKNMMAKIESLESRISSMNSSTQESLNIQTVAPIKTLTPAFNPSAGAEKISAPAINLLPEIDEQIMGFIKEKKKVTAEEVRERFQYKGKNAASARMNRLCDMGLLKKAQVGKKVYFFPC